MLLERNLALNGAGSAAENCEFSVTGAIYAVRRQYIRRARKGVRLSDDHAAGRGTGTSQRSGPSSELRSAIERPPYRSRVSAIVLCREINILAAPTVIRASAQK